MIHTHIYTFSLECSLILLYVHMGTAVCGACFVCLRCLFLRQRAGGVREEGGGVGMAHFQYIDAVCFRPLSFPVAWNCITPTATEASIAFYGAVHVCQPCSPSLSPSLPLPCPLFVFRNFVLLFCDDVLILSFSHVVQEFSTSNFFAVTYDNKFVSPDSPAVLPSITNKSLMQLAEDEGMTVEHRPVPFTEVASFKEVAACGTAVVMTTIKQIVKGDEVRGVVATNMCVAVVAVAVGGSGGVSGGGGGDIGGIGSTGGVGGHGVC